MKKLIRVVYQLPLWSYYHCQAHPSTFTRYLRQIDGIFYDMVDGDGEAERYVTTVLVQAWTILRVVSRFKRDISYEFVHFAR